MSLETEQFKPYVPAETRMAEFTLKAVLIGVLFGIIFAASTVYLALKAGLTVTASVPIHRKSVVEGKSVSVRVDLGGRRSIKDKQKNNHTEQIKRVKRKSHKT